MSATTTNTASEIKSLNPLMRNVCSGGTKNQFTNSTEAIAAVIPGTTPPITVTITTMST